MTTPDTLARLRAVIEDELGEFRQLADLPAREIDAIAARLVRAVEPVLAPVATERRPAA
ncbi:hypothetical protein [Amaricoccus sp.]|uniref:hypothetical protein n=1 Tax=Amaricoccus sp. TaxID=1872485 RepID=UPI001B4BE747|nr:hypothetical protein [Amaricoccus sp.]MBP7243287.1 hypothetical protein [Amaricoccus sp.]